MKNKILIIEDHPAISSLIQLHLKDIQYESDIANNGLEGLEKFRSGDYKLVILDVMLPLMDGLDVCKLIREEDKRIPIIMLTSKSSELNRVVGLEVGADDYITKPFSIPELMARVKTQFRRLAAMAAPNKPTMKLQIGHLTIDTEKHVASLQDKVLDLTAKEFDLLLHFANRPGHVYSRTDLLNQVWDYHYEGYEHTVNSHINRLRSKIESDPKKPKYILTVWGVGYKFNDEHN